MIYNFILTLLLFIINQPVDKIYGYRMEDDIITFEFRVDDYKKATDNDSGEFVSLVNKKISTIHVAGDFNRWERKSSLWLLNKNENGNYELVKSKSSVGKKGEVIKFKFVINGQLWVEPPVEATNQETTGLFNRSKNFTLPL